ncbi:hypothetical protein [Natrialba taiwanensis]|uniref:Uncharacterized protein n=1 Tax=Natrialba taiwanensis DSM 12281 TaxID=1230458 RepID=L9ZGZ4_9EURY|nr:hypothetical protein [Natrialba taiwanensis]ELY85604.1 hypothetical protein C484_19837 [Natrialba taiwanensis DSM 12281]
MVDLTSDEGSPSQPESRSITRWFLLDGNRFVIAAGIAITFGVASLFLSLTHVALLSNTQPLFYVFSGLIAGNMTLITVVVSINQLLLSRELQSPGELTSQIEETVDFRQEVEEVADTAAPAVPAGFLRLVVESARQETVRLDDAATKSDVLSEDVRDEISDVTDDLTIALDRIEQHIDKSDTGIFDALSTTIESNFAREIYRLERARRTAGSDLPPAIDTAFEDLRNRLREMDITRQYLKSVYLQVELSRLSRYLFYAGVPAIGVAIAVLFSLTGPTGLPFGSQVRLVVFPSAVAIGGLPLALLFSYILRTAMVAEQTAAITPFTTGQK